MNGVGISESGRFVVFDSAATNVVTGDTNNVTDIFVHDRDPDANGIFDSGNGTTLRVSVGNGGTQASGASLRPSISATGRHVSFYSIASNLVTGDTNGVGDVFVRDRDPDSNGIYDEANATTTRVSVNSSGVQSNAQSGLYGPESVFGVMPISSDGRFVAFSSFGNNLDGTDTNGTADVFLRDRDPDTNGVFDEAQSTTTRVSVTWKAEPNLGEGLQQCALSGDGRYVAYYTSVGTVVPGDTNSKPDIIVYDTVTQLPTQVSISSFGAQGNWQSGQMGLAMSRDGEWLTYHSIATTLVAGDTNARDDIFATGGFADADKDGLIDDWEKRGLYVNGDAVLDLDLPTLGANPSHRTVFVEVDSMVGMQPMTGVMADTVAAFASANVQNPDMTNGVTLIAQQDENTIPQTAWNYPPWPQFDAAKAQYFGTLAERQDLNWPAIRIAKELLINKCASSGFEPM